MGFINKLIIPLALVRYGQFVGYPPSHIQRALVE